MSSFTHPHPQHFLTVGGPVVLESQNKTVALAKCYLNLKTPVIRKAEKWL